MQLFHFWSRDLHPLQNMLLCTKFHENRMIFHWYMAIYRFSKWRPSVILKLFTTIRDHPQSLCCCMAAAACQISCQSDTQIWRHSYLNFSHIWLEMPIQAPKWGFWGNLDPWMWLFIIETARKASVKLSTVKHPLRGLTCRRVDRKCDGHTDRETDRHTHRHTHR